MRETCPPSGSACDGSRRLARASRGRRSRLTAGYEVIFDPGALREFDKLPKPQQRRIADQIDGLAENPRPTGAEKMTDVDAYKLRVRDCRIVYAVKDKALIVLIVKIGNRRDVYKDISTIKKRLKK